MNHQFLFTVGLLFMVSSPPVSAADKCPDRELYHLKVIATPAMARYDEAVRVIDGYLEIPDPDPDDFARWRKNLYEIANCEPAGSKVGKRARAKLTELGDRGVDPSDRVEPTPAKPKTTPVAAKVGTRRAEELIAKSIAHAKARQYKEAHSAYVEALGMDASVRSPHIGFAAGHSEGDDYLSAIIDLDGQMQKDLGDPYVFILRADSLHNAEQFDKAVLEYTKAMEIDNSVADAYVGRGIALTAQGAVDAAQQDFEHAIKMEYLKDPTSDIVRSILLGNASEPAKNAVAKLDLARKAALERARSHIRAPIERPTAIASAGAKAKDSPSTENAPRKTVSKCDKTLSALSNSADSFAAIFERPDHFNDPMMPAAYEKLCKRLRACYSVCGKPRCLETLNDRPKPQGVEANNKDWGCKQLD